LHGFARLAHAEAVVGLAPPDPYKSNNHSVLPPITSLRRFSLYRHKHISHPRCDLGGYPQPHESDQTRSSERQTAGIEYRWPVGLEPMRLTSIRLEDVSCNGRPHEVTSCPSGDNHPHCDRYACAAKHIPHHRRHDGEEAAVGRAVDGGERNEWGKSARYWPEDQCTNGAEEEGEDESIHGPEAVPSEAAKDPADSR
jgi:hypothetical protein